MARPRWFVHAHGWVKALAIVLGAGVSVLSLMSIVGALTENAWVRVVVALIVALAVPAFIADRARPKNDPLRAIGLATDVFALVLMGFALAFVAFPGVSRALLLREADRETVAGATAVSRVTYLLAGAAPTATDEGPANARLAALADGGSAGTLDAGVRDASAASAQPDAARAARPERTPAELFRELAPAVVNIAVKGAEGEAGGTGFLIDTEGTVATNHHVIEGATEVRIKLLDGQWIENAEIEWLTDNRADDLALLRIHTKEALKAVDLGDSEAVATGERVISIGNPLGLEHTLTDGLISSRRVYEGRPYIQMSAPVSPGNSGGPLFDMRGEVIGITTAQVAGGMFGRAQNLNLATPINVLKPMIQIDYPKRRHFGKDGAAGTW